MTVRASQVDGARNSTLWRATALGLAIAAFVAVCVTMAWPEGSLVAAQPQSVQTGNLDWTRIFATAQLAAFGVYLAALMVLRRTPTSTTRVLVLAALIQLLPLAAPLMLSTDAWSYANAGRIGVVHAGNPFADVPDAFPTEPTNVYINPAWRDDTVVYGPLFVAGAEGLAFLTRDATTLSIWLYKALAGILMVAVAVLAARMAPRGAFAAAFVGWNPVFAMQFGGAGHNDVLMIFLVVLGLALGTTGRTRFAGVAWAAAVFVKWYALILVPLQLFADRARGRQSMGPGLLVGSVAFAALATALFGSAWLGTMVPIGEHVASGEINSLALWPRLGRWLPSGVATIAPILAFAAVYVILLRTASRGRARHGLTLGLFLVASPFLFTWYVIAPAVLSAIEDDLPAMWLTLALCAYTGLLYLGRVGSVFDLF